MTDRQGEETTGGPVEAPQGYTAILRGHHGASPVPDTGAAHLVDALTQLSTLLLLTAEAADNIVAALTGQAPYAEPVRTDSGPVRTGHRTDTTPDTNPDTTADTGADSGRPRLSVVRPATPDTNGTEAS